MYTVRKGFSSENRAKGCQTKVCGRNSVKIQRPFEPNIIVSRPFDFVENIPRGMIKTSYIMNVPCVQNTGKRRRRRDNFCVNFVSVAMIWSFPLIRLPLGGIITLMVEKSKILSFVVAGRSGLIPWQKKSFCRPILCSFLVALLISNALAAQRGLIVQVGGACPAPGEGRVIHYLLTDQGAVDKAKSTHRGQDSVRVDLFSAPQLPYAENIAGRIRALYVSIHLK